MGLRWRLSLWHLVLQPMSCLCHCYLFAYVCVTSARYLIWGVSLVPQGAQCSAHGSIQ